MRRPVKYKTRQAARNRMIAIATSAVLGVGVIGGAAAAVLLSRDDGAIDGIGTGVDTQNGTPAISDTVGIEDGTDAVTTDPVDTEAVTDAVTETEAVTDNGAANAIERLCFPI